MVTATSRELIRIKARWDHHVMPLAGGSLDQPAALIEAMDVLDAAVTRAIADRART